MSHGSHGFRVEKPVFYGLIHGVQWKTYGTYWDIHEINIYGIWNKYWDIHKYGDHMEIIGYEWHSEWHSEWGMNGDGRKVEDPWWWDSPRVSPLTIRTMGWSFNLMDLGAELWYPQWNSHVLIHLVGIMISKTIGCRATLFSDKPILQFCFFLDKSTFFESKKRTHSFFLALSSSNPNIVVNVPMEFRES
jgi:hypothetical protein